jgi:hypothetical protein
MKRRAHIELAVIERRGEPAVVVEEIVDGGHAAFLST